MQRADRSAAARCNDTGMDRPDIQHASKAAARRMASLARHDTHRIERMAKYMNGAAGMMVRLCRWECEDHCATTVYTDANWAGVQGDAPNQEQGHDNQRTAPLEKLEVHTEDSGVVVRRVRALRVQQRWKGGAEHGAHREVSRREPRSEHQD